MGCVHWLSMTKPPTLPLITDSYWPLRGPLPKKKMAGWWPTKCYKGKSFAWKTMAPTYASLIMWPTSLSWRSHVELRGGVLPLPGRWSFSSSPSFRCRCASFSSSLWACWSPRPWPWPRRSSFSFFGRSLACCPFLRQTVAVASSQQLAKAIGLWKCKKQSLDVWIFLFSFTLLSYNFNCITQSRD